MEIAPIPKGFERQWLKCNKCGNAYHYDYVPYALSSPIMTLPCNCDVGARWEDRTTLITADEAMIINSSK